MKSKQTLVILGYTLLLFAACKKEKEETICGCIDKRAKNYKVNATCNDSSCVYTSNIIFWSNTMTDGDKIIVAMGGKKDTITLRYDGNYLTPNCAGVQLAKFSLSPGTYSYHAENEPGPFHETWDNTITLDTMHWSADCVFENLQ